MKSILYEFNKQIFYLLPRLLRREKSVHFLWLWFKIVYFPDGWTAFLAGILKEQGDGIAEILNKEISRLKDGVEVLNEEVEQWIQKAQALEDRNHELEGGLESATNLVVSQARTIEIGLEEQARLDKRILAIRDAIDEKDEENEGLYEDIAQLKADLSAVRRHNHELQRSNRLLKFTHKQFKQRSDDYLIRLKEHMGRLEENVRLYRIAVGLFVVLGVFATLILLAVVMLGGG